MPALPRFDFFHNVSPLVNPLDRSVKSWYYHPLRTTRAHVPNLCMGNLVQGIFGAKFVSFEVCLIEMQVFLYFCISVMGMFWIYDV